MVLYDDYQLRKAVIEHNLILCCNIHLLLRQRVVYLTVFYLHFQ